MPAPFLPSDFCRLPIAHRGLHDVQAGRPENSLAAVRAAVDVGYGIEIDVQMSADGHAMVFHDDTLDRLTAKAGPIVAHTAEALGRIMLSGSDQTIPTLAQVLAKVSGRVPLLIEIKDQSGGQGGSDGRLEAAVAADLVGYVGPVALMSFNPGQVARVAGYAPTIARGLTTCAFDPAQWPDMSPQTCARLRDIPDAAALGASFISHEWDDLDRPRVAELAAAGVAILCWTLRSPEAEAVARLRACTITFEGYLPPIPA